MGVGRALGWVCDAGARLPAWAALFGLARARHGARWFLGGKKEARVLPLFIGRVGTFFLRVCVRLPGLLALLGLALLGLAHQLLDGENFALVW